MGKGNAILGFARGAVGSFVFSRIKGQEIIKARNVKPRNKRSRKQIFHRSRLSSVYKFTKQLPPGLLEGAFDDQRPLENWQACFTRHNIERGVMQPKEWVNDEFRPAFGRWLMSTGPVAGDIVSVSSIEAGSYIGAVGIAVAGVPHSERVSVFSAELIRLYGVQNGDIVTFVIYDVGPASEMRDPKYSAARRVPEVLVDSFRIDTADTRLLTDVVKFMEHFTYALSPGFPSAWLGVRLDTVHQPSVAVIVSRVEGQKVLCNTSHLVWPTANEAFWEMFESDEWRANVLRSWGVSRTVLLAGE